MKIWIRIAIATSIIFSNQAMTIAQEISPSQTPKAILESLESSTKRGLAYLQNTGQAKDGTFSAEAGPGVTALVLTSMLRNGITLDNASMMKGLKALEGFVKPDGGIYGNGRLMNYETCVAVLCFAEANKKAGTAVTTRSFPTPRSFSSRYKLPIPTPPSLEELDMQEKDAPTFRIRPIYWRLCILFK